MENSQLVLIADDEKLYELVNRLKNEHLLQTIAENSRITLARLIIPDPVKNVKIITAKLALLKNRASKASTLQIDSNKKNQLINFISKELELSTQLKVINPTDGQKLNLTFGEIPRNGCFYIKHPIVTDVYIPFSSYAQVLLSEKEAAFKSLASSLGAKSINLVDAKFYDVRGSLTTSLDVAEVVSAKIGIRANFDKDGKVQRCVYSEYGPPRQAPRIPNDIKKWVEIDPDLRLMAKDRLEGNLLKNTIKLTFNENLISNATLSTKIATKGFDIGGSYHKSNGSVWYFEVEYYPIEG